MSTEYLVVKVEDSDTTTQLRSVTGKFPMLQLEDGETCISEPLSIARVLSNNKFGFYGPDIAQRAQADQWIDIITSKIVPILDSLVKQVNGELESDVKSFSLQLKAFKTELAIFEKHFKLRNFLVGYSLSLADVYLIAVLLPAFRLFLEKKTRLKEFPNLSRYMTLNLQSFHFEEAFGQVQLCNKSATPPAPKPKEEKPQGKPE